MDPLTEHGFMQGVHRACSTATPLTPQSVTGMQRWWSRALFALAFVGLLGAGSASAAIRVAVEEGTNARSGGGTGKDVVTQLNNSTLFSFSAKLVTCADLDSDSELANYDVVIFGDTGNNNNDHDACAAKVRAWAEKGHGVVGAGWIDYSITSNTGGDAELDLMLPIDAEKPQNEFCGSASTVTVTDTTHPIMAGLPTTFATTTSGHVELNSYPLDNANAKTLATVSGSSCNVVNSSNPKITVAVSSIGTAGRGVYLGPLYMASTGYNPTDLRTGNFDKLLEQAVAWAATIRVAVEEGTTARSGGGTGKDVVTQLNNSTAFPFKATLVTCAEIDSDAELAAYDVVIFGDTGSNNNDHDSCAAKVRTWAEAGHGVVGVGWIDYSITSTTGGDAELDLMLPIDAEKPQNEFCNSGTTITITDATHPVTAGLPTSFLTTTSANVEVNTYAMDNANAKVLGVASGSCSVVSSTNPKITIAVSSIGSSGRGVYLGPMYMSNTGYNPTDTRTGNFDKLLEQAVGWAAGATSAVLDTDADGIVDTADNCPTVANSTQTNTDGDTQGDACDTDDDNDTVLDTADNCPLNANTTQTNTDGDSQGDTCDTDDDNDTVLDTSDNCSLVSNASQTNTDGDSQGDACDTDDDNDTVADTSDNCPLNANTSQTNTDGDSQGDACDSDDDNDGVTDADDNCALDVNPDQLDSDGDLDGDVCDDNDDDDDFDDDDDNCPLDANDDQQDTDGDLEGDVCDDDDDNDSVADGSDNCAVTPNTDQADNDADGRGDVCDADDDNDSIADGSDNCAFTSNTDQTNTDGDSEGDACDTDDDNDGIRDTSDNCALTANPDQADNDGDAQGDACDTDDDNDSITDNADNCPEDANAAQTDTDGDAQGDVCDADDDNDTLDDSSDNCPLIVNLNQANLDGDALGDLCDDDQDGDNANSDADCNDRDATVQVEQTYYADVDGDGYGDAAADSSICSSEPTDGLVRNGDDNCPADANPDQLDTDEDGQGDACDTDDDNDSVADTSDNCPLVPNTSQQDTDQNGVGNACEADEDGDGYADTNDNCPTVANDDQADLDGDQIGDACDSDADGDLVANTDDCDDFDPTITAQLNYYVDVDGDGFGDDATITQICETVAPEGYVAVGGDNCPDISNPDQLDSDIDGQGNACDEDDDNDTILDGVDNCPLVSNQDQLDSDSNGVGDACEDDTDGDGVSNDSDNCPEVVNAEQGDLDQDGIGDVCDDDADGDDVLVSEDCDDLNADIFESQLYYADPENDGFGDPDTFVSVCSMTAPEGYVADNTDNCPDDRNPSQADDDEDGIGNACDDGEDTPTPTPSDETPTPGDDTPTPGNETPTPSDVTPTPDDTSPTPEPDNPGCSCNSAAPISTPLPLGALALMGLALGFLRRRR